MRTFFTRKNTANSRSSDNQAEFEKWLARLPVYPIESGDGKPKLETAEGGKQQALYCEYIDVAENCVSCLIDPDLANAFELLDQLGERINELLVKFDSLPARSAQEVWPFNRQLRALRCSINLIRFSNENVLRSLGHTSEITAEQQNRLASFRRQIIKSLYWYINKSLQFAQAAQRDNEVAEAPTWSPALQN